VQRLPQRIATITVSTMCVLLVALGIQEATRTTPPQLPPACEPPPPPSYAENCKSNPPVAFDFLVDIAADEFDINPKMLATTVYKESSCNAKARGSSGEIGLGQVNPKVWLQVLREEGIADSSRDLYDPQVNLRATAFILDRLRDRVSRRAPVVFARYNGSGPKARRYAVEQVESYRDTWDEDPTL
jgi:soluble lytic murein transglycosylase-like protein